MDHRFLVSVAISSQRFRLCVVMVTVNPAAALDPSRLHHIKQQVWRRAVNFLFDRSHAPQPPRHQPRGVDAAAKLTQMSGLTDVGRI